MSSFFFFNDTATTEIYTLSLHDALPISFGPEGPQRRELAVNAHRIRSGVQRGSELRGRAYTERADIRDRKSTRLNSSHGYISYAVFCLKKKMTLTVVLMIQTRLSSVRAV